MCEGKLSSAALSQAKAEGQEGPSPLLCSVSTPPSSAPFPSPQLALHRAALERSVGRLLAEAGDGALYASRPWRRFLLGLPLPCLVSLYAAYLLEGLC